MASGGNERDMVKSAKQQIKDAETVAGGAKLVDVGSSRDNVLRMFKDCEKHAHLSPDLVDDHAALAGLLYTSIKINTVKNLEYAVGNERVLTGISEFRRQFIAMLVPALKARMIPGDPARAKRRAGGKAKIPRYDIPEACPH